MAKTQDLIFIEQCFYDILNKDNTNNALKKISNAVNRMFDIKTTVTISKNTTNEFFGMSVYPEMSDTQKIVSLIISNAKISDVVEEWQKIDNWVIEIDSMSLYDMKFNPQELTAMLLHEIGHVRYSSSIPVRLSKVFKTEYAMANYKIKSMMTDKRFASLFILPILDAVSSKKYNYVDDRREIEADKLVVSYGYGGILNDVFDKLMTTTASSYITKSDKDLDKETEVMTAWVINNLSSLEYRKTKLRQALVVQKMKSPSKYIKDSIDMIYKIFFVDDPDLERMMSMESSTGVREDPLCEMISDQNLIKYKNFVIKESVSNLFDGKKLKKIHQIDLDILRVEIDKISTNDDKIFLLDRINRYIEIINTGLEYYETERDRLVPQSKHQLKMYLEELEKMRSQVLYVKITDKQYGVFIKYPKGYEG
jgi:hypothetical protein